jgi:hypothetical protein
MTLCNQARPTVHLIQPSKSAQPMVQNRGSFPPPSPAWLHRLIPSSRRQEAGQGVTKGLAQSPTSRLIPNGSRGAHRGGLPTVRKTVAERWSSAVQTRGGRSGTLGRWVAEDKEGARGTLGWAEGRQGMAVSSARKTTVENSGSQRHWPATRLQPVAIQRGVDAGPLGWLRQWKRWAGGGAHWWKETVGGRVEQAWIEQGGEEAKRNRVSPLDLALLLNAVKTGGDGKNVGELEAPVGMVAAPVWKLACGLNAAADGWAAPVWLFSRISKQLRLLNSKRMPSITLQILNICMILNLSFLNNYLNCSDF